MSYETNDKKKENKQMRIKTMDEMYGWSILGLETTSVKYQIIWTYNGSKYHVFFRKVVLEAKK